MQAKAIGRPTEFRTIQCLTQALHGPLGTRGPSEDCLAQALHGPLKQGHRTMKREDITEVKFFRTGYSLLSEISKVAHNSRVVYCTNTFINVKNIFCQ